jgi:hypothetical protein
MAYEIYADDVQLIISAPPSNFSAAVVQLEQCVLSINEWLRNNYLLLNVSKTEVILVGTEAQLKKVQNCQINFCGTIIYPKMSVRDLGVTLDSHLSMEKQVMKVCSSAYSHLGAIQRIRRSIDQQTTAMIVHGLVLSRIDFCLSLFYGVKGTYLDKLKQVIHASFRVIHHLRKYDHISEKLTIKQRILLRISTITFLAIKYGQPSYLADLLRPYMPPRELRSQDSQFLIAPAAQTTIGERAFSVAAPSLWNKLDLNIRNARNKEQFQASMTNLLLSGVLI